MNTTTVAPFNIIGLAIRTTNENGQSATDIPQLWKRFLSENIAAQIPYKMDSDVYCVYMDYEKDHTKPYTTLLGCKTDSLHNLPHGLTGKSFPGGSYTVYTTQGKITDGIVFQQWTTIWNSNIPRAYTADFEVYGEKAQHPDNAAVDIFIAVK